MEAYRTKIDEIDKQMIRLLSDRMALSLQIAEHKKQLNLPIQDPEREQELLQRLANESKNSGLDAGFIQQLFKMILEESRRVQADRV